ncbi:MAG TPA: hypothetical protein V6D05_12530 [Stenomitos sp.]
MARHARIARRSQQPIAIAVTRSLPRANKLALAGLAVATLAASQVSPVLALGLVGLMLWQAFGAKKA